jgi:pimeloyl-ACP methyl ester carboxylesterase
MAMAAAACVADRPGGGAPVSSPPVATRPPVPRPASRAPVGAACLTAVERRGEVRFTSGSGGELAGVVLGDGPSGIVMAHGPHGDVCELLPYARVLVGLGYRVLVFDFNGFGASGAGPGFPAYGRLDLDVAAAVAALRSSGARRVVLLGSEFGGLGAVIAAADMRPAVDGVVDLSAPDELAGMDGRAAAARLGVPALFVVSAADTNLDEVRGMYDAAPARYRQLDLTPADGMHGLGMVDPGLDPHAGEVRAVIEDFLRRATAPARPAGAVRSLRISAHRR